MTTKKLNTMLEKIVKITDINNKSHIGILHQVTKYVVRLNNEEYPVQTNNCYLLECFNESILYQNKFIKNCIEYKSPKGISLKKFL